MKTILSNANLIDCVEAGIPVEIVPVTLMGLIAPVRGTNPNVGRNPVQPQRVEGEEIDPSVSDPMLNATQPAAVADAGPADDPLEPCRGFHGLRVIPPNQ